MILDNYINHIQNEAYPFKPNAINNVVPIKNNETGPLYHGSPVQNLKVIDPKKSKDNKIYGSWDIQFAASFCFEGKFNMSDRYNMWTFTIEVNEKHLLSKPCSIYVVDSKWNLDKVNKNVGPEMFSVHKAKVIKEYKFNSVKECLSNYNVKVVVK